ncbi:hypothetical protein ACJJH9_03225 [Microbulbifer sp. DLAB2-AF]|uniref:hypothetical protein n=1 Tax=Microbulbifer sp. DLAB2-AF TaxID=3243395 RepID=UPI00403A2D39
MIKPPSFYPHQGVHRDFFIISKSKETNRIRLDLEALGGMRFEIGKFLLYIWNVQFSNIMLFGYGILDGVFKVGPESLDKAPKSPGAGAYVVITIDNDLINIKTDFGGLHVLYYSDDIVTNRLYLSALAANRIDYKAIASVFHSNHMFCQQFNVLNMPIKGLKIALPGKQICIKEKIDFVDDYANSNVDLGSSLIITPDEYHFLIRQAATEIVNNVNSILDSGLPVICDLTGGRDSRIVLAALIASGRVRDVIFNTKFSLPDAKLISTVSKSEEFKKKTLDRNIATGLVKKYGGEYGCKIEAETFYHYSLSDKINARRSQLFGAYHFVHPSQLNSVSAIFPTPRIRMMGGCGEVYRDYYQNFFGHNLSEHDYINVLDSALLNRSLIKDGNLSYDVSRESFFETFEKLPGVSFSEKLDSHYFVFRNRFHFGSNNSTVSKDVNISPILVPSLFAASRLLPRKEKRTSRILFDITKELCEELAYCEYDKPNDFDLINSQYHKKSKYDGHLIPIDPAPELLTNLNNNWKLRKLRPSAEKFNYTDLCKKEIDKSLSYIASRSNSSSRHIDRELSLFMNNFHKNIPTRLGSIMSKFHGLEDYFKFLY